MGNTAKFTSSDWDKQINDAANSGIDGFALNMAWDWEHNADALELAFAAAAKRSGFVMIFSFDYAGNGPWELDAVVEYILKYREHRSYWNHIPGRPLVSTFEGPDHADDWIEIKDRTNCFFMPDWSSQGAEPALALGNHVADGLFSWAAWPWGDRDIDTFTDVAYQRALAAAGNKPYMMPVSPWFFTNLPGYHKNWLWTGGKTGGLMWFQRWQQIWDLKPEYVQIISWNDYGESHHIADPDPKQYEEWTAVGKPPMDYVTNHGAWRLALPFLIEMYKKGTAGVDRESVVVWSHQTYSKACENGGTTGNTASQLQLEMDPSQSSPDYFYVAAVLKAPYTFQGWSGGVTWEDSQYYVGEDDWLFKPWGGVGLYYTAVKMRHPGRQSLALSREVNHEYFSWEFEETCYKDEPVNWNAQVQGASWEYRDTNGWGIEGTKYPQLNTSSQQCIGGWSVDGFDDICSFTCSKDYCPPGACVCNKASSLYPERKKKEKSKANVFNHSGASLVSYQCGKVSTFGRRTVTQITADSAPSPATTASRVAISTVQPRWYPRRFLRHPPSLRTRVLQELPVDSTNSCASMLALSDSVPGILALVPRLDRWCSRLPSPFRAIHAIDSTLLMTTGFVSLPVVASIVLTHVGPRSDLDGKFRTRNCSKQRMITRASGGRQPPRHVRQSGFAN